MVPILVSAATIINLPPPRFQNVIFTSYSPSTSNHAKWFTSERNYDVITCNYATNQADLFADYTFHRRGSKFQNYKYLWDHSNISQMYTNYFILDDDILITPKDINYLFDILQRYNLYALQPSFDRKSKYSHIITLKQKNSFMRYVNFLEVCVMMFNHRGMHLAMEIYDSRLIGWGVDYLTLQYIAENVENSKKAFAIVDAVTCVNPKTKVRAIDKLGNNGVKAQLYDQVIRELNISGYYKHQIYSTISLDISN